MIKIYRTIKYSLNDLICNKTIIILQVLMK